MTGTPTPDTPFLTGLTGQQLFASQIYVTPTGGGQQTLANALAGGGGASPLPAIVVPAVTANAALGTLPANAIIQWVIFRETAGQSVNVGIGTSSGGTQVLTAQSVPANGTLTVATTGLTENWFSATLTQLLFLTSASWGGASINCSVAYVIGP